MACNSSRLDRAEWRNQGELVLPMDATELPELRSVDVSHRLGYFRDERFVIFGYCCGGGEVIWKDRCSSGFGTGGWKFLLYELAPLAAHYGGVLGGMAGPGSHVLLVDRLRGMVYTTARERAEEFLATVYGDPPPARRCLCAFMDCALCPVRACPNSSVDSKS